MNKYKLSVIIPTFNTGDLLKDLFDSIKNQTIGFDNVEIIFVDDASSDAHTLDLINSYESDYSNCKAIFLNENSSFPGKPRNIGLEASTSDFVIFADHDDSYNPDAFEKLYDNITDNNADVAISNFNQVFQEKIIPFKSIFKDSKAIKIDSIDENKDILRIPAAIWTRLFRKECLIKNNIRFLEGMLAEDVYVATNVSLNANGIIYLNDFYGYNYKIRDRKGNKSTIHIRNKKYIEAMLNGYYEISNMLKEQNKEKYGKIIFKSHLTSWLYTIVLSRIDLKDKTELLIKSSNIFKKYYTEDPYFQGKYVNLANYIINEDFSRAILEANKLEEDINSKSYKKILRKLKGKFLR